MLGDRFSRRGWREAWKDKMIFAGLLYLIVHNAVLLRKESLVHLRARVRLSVIMFVNILMMM